MYAKRTAAISFGLQVIIPFFTCFRFSGTFFFSNQTKEIFSVLCGGKFTSFLFVPYQFPFLVCFDSKFKLNQTQVLAASIQILNLSWI